MTKETAQAAMEQHGSQRKAAAALGVSRKVLRRALERIEPSEPGEAAEKPADVSRLSGGFSLAGRRVLAARPTDVWKARFYALRRGVGYTIAYLSEMWGNSEDTVRSKAQKFGALRYVEDTKHPGQYLVCATHPETPKGN